MGPYHPALLQPIGLTLHLRGECVARVDPPVIGYGKREIAALCADQPIEDALVLVERTCAQAGGAYRLALCMALEAAMDATITPRARLTRVALGEIERILARLNLLGRVARALGMIDIYRGALDQREVFYEAAAEDLGGRVFWGANVAGGVRPDLGFDALRGALESFTEDLPNWQSVVPGRAGLAALLVGLGPVSAEQIASARLSGNVARASGDETDLRRKQPYGGYNDLTIEWPEASEARAGDAAARIVRAAEDLATSHAIARAALDALPNATGEPRVAIVPPDAAIEATASVEGPHGIAAVSVVLTPELTLERVTLDTAQDRLIALLPDVLEGCTLSKVPAVIASLDVCADCADQ